MTISPSRVPAGVPTGGQFANTIKAEALIALDNDPNQDMLPFAADYEFELAPDAPRAFTDLSPAAQANAIAAYESQNEQSIVERAYDNAYENNRERVANFGLSNLDVYADFNPVQGRGVGFHGRVSAAKLTTPGYDADGMPEPPELLDPKYGFDAETEDAPTIVIDNVRGCTFHTRTDVEWSPASWTLDESDPHDAARLAARESYEEDVEAFFQDLSWALETCGDADVDYYTSNDFLAEEMVEREYDLRFDAEGNEI